MAKKNNSVKDEAKKSADRTIVESKPISIETEGGNITGKFIKTQTRVSKKGEEYTGHIFEAKSGIVKGRESGNPEPIGAGRYFVFGRTRLDRLMREVTSGEFVKVTYLGKAPNEDGKEGEHHSFEVTYID